MNLAWALSAVVGAMLGWFCGRAQSWLGSVSSWKHRTEKAEGVLDHIAALAGSGADLQVIHDIAREHLDALPK